MSIKDSARLTRFGKICQGIFLGVVLLVLFSFGAFMLVLGLSAEADSSIEGRSIALLMGVAFCVMAVLLIYVWKRSSKEWPSAVAERIDVPESVQNLDSARLMMNIPNALRGQDSPKDAVIVAGKSIRSSRRTIMVVLAIALGLLYLGWNVESIFPEWHVSAIYIFMGFGALLLIIGLAGLWPSNWHKRFLGFIAIPEGVYVHGQGVYPDGHEWATPETRWLFVPWANVVDVRVGLDFRGGGPVWSTSIKLSLRVTPDEAREWFPYADNEPSDDGLNLIVSLDYCDSGSPPKETVSRLQQFWAPE